jgi:hypothetical protein
MIWVGILFIYSKCNLINPGNKESYPCRTNIIWLNARLTKKRTETIISWKVIIGNRKKGYGTSL